MGSRPGAWLALGAASLVMAACAARRPVLYPNHVVNEVGWDAAQRDVDECLEFARAYGTGSSPGARTAGSTAAGSAIGAAVGGAAGAVRGRAGTQAAAGAAGGAAAGLLRGLFRWREPGAVERQFVNTCLAEQGYHVIGWR